MFTVYLQQINILNNIYNRFYFFFLRIFIYLEDLHYHRVFLVYR